MARAAGIELDRGKVTGGKTGEVLQTERDWVASGYRETELLLLLAHEQDREREKESSPNLRRRKSIKTPNSPSQLFLIASSRIPR